MHLISVEDLGKNLCLLGSLKHELTIYFKAGKQIWGGTGTRLNLPESFKEDS